MAIKLTTTKEAAELHGLKILVHGPAGVGKTTLASTTGESTVIISAEAGLLSLGKTEIPVIEVKSIEDIEEAYALITSDQGKGFKWVILDSVSEIAETVLAFEMRQVKDPRQAYGQLQTKMMDLMRAFRDLSGKNVVFTCKQERIKDENGITLYVPMMPGTKLSQQVPYLFDIVFAMRILTNSEGADERWIQTRKDMQYDAKDRSGVLDAFEPPSLEHIATKIKQSFSTTQPKIKEVKNG